MPTTFTLTRGATAAMIIALSAGPGGAGTLGVHLDDEVARDLGVLHVHVEARAS